MTRPPLTARQPAVLIGAALGTCGAVATAAVESRTPTGVDLVAFAAFALPALSGFVISFGVFSPATHDAAVDAARKEGTQ